MVGTHENSACFATDFAVTPTTASRIEYSQSRKVLQRDARFSLKGSLVLVVVRDLIFVPLPPETRQMLIARETRDSVNDWC